MTQVFYQGSVRTLEVSDEAESNWLMFVKPARNALERNLVAFQRGHHVVFLATRHLPPGDELLFWFAPDYCKMLCELASVCESCLFLSVRVVCSCL